MFCYFLNTRIWQKNKFVIGNVYGGTKPEILWRGKMKRQPSVAIILVNYNGLQDTEECLESLSQLEYQNWKTIIVDNCSKDAEMLEELLKEKYPNAIPILSTENLGFAGGNNLGIQYAENAGFDYVLLLNNDTVVKKDFLNHLIECAQNRSDTGIVIGKILSYFDPQKICFAGGSIDLDRAHICHWHCGEVDKGVSEIREITFATGCLMLIPMSVIHRVGMIDDAYFMYAEDADYCIQVLKAGYKIYYSSDAVIFHKVSASSGGNNSALSQYYRTRNELMLFTRYATKKYTAILFMYIRLLIRNARRQFSPKYTLMGISDFKRGILGQKQL